MTDIKSPFGMDLKLGKQQVYQDQYNPALLQPIARSLCREQLAIQTFNGIDIWTSHELSWLDPDGKPQVAIAEFAIPVNSSNLIESKSFKYYLNSFNQTRLDEQELHKRIVYDLSLAADGNVTLNIISLDNYQSAPTQLADFICVDELPLTSPNYTPDPNLIRPANHHGNQKLVSHLLKSNCPVTGQPDWASVWLEIEGQTINEESLLAYLVSYRNHQDFHENCVEQMYCDIWTRLQPCSLWIYARYTRRGGLDINPFRASHQQRPPNVRGARQ
jgi:7-cyano-7-deazaguanine reductase